MKHTPEQLKMEFTPVKYCECGCGLPAPIAAATNTKRGWLKGKPKRFVSGHNARKPIALEGPNPSGLCMCGCGQPAPIATKNNARLGHVKGHPVHFILGHHHKIRLRRSVASRFWEKIVRRRDGCWLWRGAKTDFGYGQLRIDDRAILTHRFSWELHYGEIPDGLYVLHRCDVPACIRPDHLFLGTLADNNADMVAKGRHRPNPPRGEANPNARLTSEQVRDMRDQYAQGVRQEDLARQYGVRQTTISNIVCRKSWKHIL